MEIRFPRLMALAKRMVPGAFEDPQRVIGACAYCDRPVLYRDGDRDARGRPRHDPCEREVTRSQLDRVSADRIFLRALAIVRELPSVVPHANVMVLLSMVQANDWTGWKTLIVRCDFCCFTSHTITVASWLPDASRFPNGDQATAATAAVCPCSVRSVSPDETFHTRIVLS